MKWWVLALVVACCGDKEKVEFECDEDRPCGFGSQCIEGFCSAGSCSTSSQCPIEFYCNNDRQCVPGCQNDDDCKPGYECDEALLTCEKGACEDTHVDCGFREFCNTISGECYDAGGQYCKPCDADNQLYDCNDGENLNNYCINGACGVDCSDGQECPSGFECYPFVDAWGNIVTYQCFTYCWLYEDYEPGSFVVPPAPAGAPVPLAECQQ